MALETGAAPARRSGGRRATEEVGRGADGSGLPGGTPSPLGTKYRFTCPVCGDGNADATYKTGRDGEPRWFVGCKSLKCPTGAAYLDGLGEALGLGRGHTPDTLAVAARLLARGSGRRAEAEPLPSLATIQGWARRLLASPTPLRYLTEARGLSLDVIRENGIGWDGRRLIFPMFRGGELVAAKWRLPKGGAQMRSWPGEGRAWPLYPEPDPAWRRRLLVAGELDALRALSAGLPAASVTLGAGHWRDDWTDALHGLRVVVCFDNNEALLARRRTDALVAAGIDARRLDLRRLGLRTPKGDLSDYLSRGDGSERLQTALRAAWQGARRGR